MRYNCPEVTLTPLNDLYFEVRRLLSLNPLSRLALLKQAVESFVALCFTLLINTSSEVCETGYHVFRMSNENLRDKQEDESDDSESASSEEGRGSSLVTFFNNLVSGGRLVFFMLL